MKDSLSVLLLFSAGEKPYLALRIRNPKEDVLRLCQTLVEDFASVAVEDA